MRREIEKLINSEITAYKISKETGVSVGNISELKSGKRKIGNLTLDTAEKFYDYYQKIKAEIE